MAGIAGIEDNYGLARAAYHGDFQQPPPYLPGGITFNNNPELAHLMSLLSGKILPMIVGHDKFLPQMSPGQFISDQYVMRNYQAAGQANIEYSAGSAKNDLAKVFLGMRALNTDAPPSENNRRQADTFAEIASNPVVASVLRMVGGPVVEDLLYGLKGDPTALAASVNRSGFFRAGAGGNKQMAADDLKLYTQNLYNNLYDPQGRRAKAADYVKNYNPDADATSVEDYNNADLVKELKSYAKMQDKTIVSLNELTKRLQTAAKTGDDTTQQKIKETITEVYKKFVNGDEEDVNKQAAAIAKFSEAVATFQQSVKSKGIAGVEPILQSNEVTQTTALLAAEENNLRQMRGFNASQMSAVRDHLFSRGMLPQAVGSLTPAARVQLIASDYQKYEDKDFERIAEAQAKTELEGDARYKELASGNSGEQETARNMLSVKTAEKVKELKTVTAAAAGYVANNGTDHISAAAVLRQPGATALLAATDVRRESDILSKYPPALDAIRAIYADNSRPVYDTRELIKTYSVLAQGAETQMSPEAIAPFMFSVQQNAKKAGVGLEQLLALATYNDNAGSLARLSAPQKLATLDQTIADINQQRDEGKFSTPAPGMPSLEDTARAKTDFAISGAKSRLTKERGGALNVYLANERELKDTNFGRAMEALREGRDTFEFEDEAGKVTTKNIYEEQGRNYAYLRELAPGEFRARISTAASSGIYTTLLQAIDPVYHRRTQLEELVGHYQGHVVVHRPGDKKVISQELKRTLTTAMHDVAANRVAFTEQPKAVMAAIKAQMAAKYVAEGKTQAEADRAADDEFRENFGDDAQAISTINKVLNSVRAANPGFDFNAAVLGSKADIEKAALEADKTARDNDVLSRLNLQLSSAGTPAARAREYLKRVGETGGKPTIAGVVSATAGTIPDAELNSPVVNEIMGVTAEDLALIEAQKADAEQKNETTKARALQALQDANSHDTTVTESLLHLSGLGKNNPRFEKKLNSILARKATPKELNAEIDKFIQTLPPGAIRDDNQKQLLYAAIRSARAQNIVGRIPVGSPADASQEVKQEAAPAANAQATPAAPPPTSPAAGPADPSAGVSLTPATPAATTAAAAAVSSTTAGSTSTPPATTVAQNTTPAPASAATRPAPNEPIEPKEPTRISGELTLVNLDKAIVAAVVKKLNQDEPAANYTYSSSYS